MGNPESRKAIFVIPALIFVTYAAGVIASNYVGNRSLSIMMVGVALISFFGFLKLDRASGVDERSMRLAIAASLIIVYLALLSTFAFWREGRELSKAAEPLLNHFTTITGLVIAFYFGASAYTEVMGRRKERNNKDD